MISHTSNGGRLQWPSPPRRGIMRCTYFTPYYIPTRQDRNYSTEVGCDPQAGICVVVLAPVAQAPQAWSHAICSAENGVGAGGVVSEVGLLVDIFGMTET